MVLALVRERKQERVARRVRKMKEVCRGFRYGRRGSEEDRQSHVNSRDGKSRLHPPP